MRLLSIIFAVINLSFCEAETVKDRREIIFKYTDEIIATVEKRLKKEEGLRAIGISGGGDSDGLFILSIFIFNSSRPAFQEN